MLRATRAGELARTPLPAAGHPQPWRRRVQIDGSEVTICAIGSDTVRRMPRADLPSHEAARGTRRSPAGRLRRRRLAAGALALGLACAAVVAMGCGADDTAATTGATHAAPGVTTTASAPSKAPAAPDSSVPRSSASAFAGGQAFALLREQVRRYGWRPAGSKALRRLAVRLRALLPRGRFESVPGHPGLRNIVGTVPGRSPAILVGAHYDVEARPRGFVGANDGAAGTAAVVTLARAFARAPRPRGARELRFVLFDGEEEPAGCVPFEDCGLRGSKAYAKRYAADIGSMILLDYIAEKRGLSIPHEAGSDPELWAQLQRAAQDVGVADVFPAIDAPLRIIDDHTPFTGRGVAAIDIIDFDYPQRDSLADNLTAVSERSLDAVGEAVHRLVARLRVS
jgi:glutaminyl-peptide cyclotransferase